MQEALTGKGWVSFDFSPGTDADGFAVRRETAEEFGLETMSDLAAITEARWSGAWREGCPDNPVCGPGLKDTYGIDLAALPVESLSPCSTDIATALNDAARSMSRRSAPRSPPRSRR